MILGWRAYSLGVLMILAGGTAYAGGPWTGTKAPPCAECPPLVWPTPVPSSPLQVQPDAMGQAPAAPSAPDSANASSANDTASAPQAGTEGGVSFAPNMFGDAFGRPSLLSISRPSVIPGTAAVSVNFPGTPIPGLFTASAPNANPSNVISFTANSAFTRFGTTFTAGTVYTSQGAFPSTGFTTTYTPIPIAQQAQETAAALRYAQTQFGPGGTLTYLQNQSVATSTKVIEPGYKLISPNDDLISLYTLDTEYNYLIPGTPATVIPRTINLNLPSPSDGGVVGRTKISDDNNPLPRDRVIFNYDYFNNAQIGVGADVHRFSVGFEKTFLDQSMSVEVRLPFASTLDNDVVADGATSTGRMELGNLNITLKGLVASGQTFNAAVGLGIAVPTADDLNVRLADGTPVVRYQNDAVVLTPYAAYLWTPNDRLFFQNWYEISFDANGNRIQADPTLTTGLTPVGSLTDQALLQIDADLGYWVYRSESPSRVLRGVAPFFEVHYNTALGHANQVQTGNLVIGPSSSSYNELNLSFGAITQLGNNSLLSFGAVFPVTSNRSFDYQLGIHATVFFGPTARDRNRAQSASSF